MALKPAASKSPAPNPGAFSFSTALSEAKLDAPKREVVMEALRVGPGNKRDKRYYTAKAAESLVPLLMARPKIFATPHPQPGQRAVNNLQDWVATVTEAWVEGGRALVRVKISAPWLWQLAEDAPGQLALSIEGTGAGQQAVREGAPCFEIERIEALNAMKFVDYSGNTAMGALLVEGEAEPETTSQEAATMDYKLLTLALIKEHRPDLLEAIVAEAVAPLKAELTEAQEKAKTAAAPADVKAAVEAATKDLREGFTASMDELRTRLSESEKKADQLEVREKIRNKRALIDTLLAEAKLAPEAKTELFKNRLYSLVERTVQKDGKAEVVTVEAQAKAEIAEQIRLTTEAFGVVREGGAGAGKTVTEALVPVDEEERQVVFNRTQLGIGPTLAEHRAKKAAAAAKKDGAAA